MDCQSCHNPHGSSVGLMHSDIDGTDVCLSCHAEYSGPFIFEHEPVSEGCETCHEPHGTIADNLLQQNEPFICLQCHEMHFHAGLQGHEDEEVYSQAYDPDQTPQNVITYPGGLIPNNGPDSYRQAFTTKCTQCHMMVHGTDLPSQTVPGRGDGLMR
jgi:DmsE family decaheme c-type cytochrome